MSQSRFRACRNGSLMRVPIARRSRWWSRRSRRCPTMSSFALYTSSVEEVPGDVADAMLLVLGVDGLEGADREVDVAWSTA